MEKFDVTIIGAGAAGMMCAIEAGRRGRRVLLIDRAPKPGEKIRISGGGRCNFTNTRTSAQNFLSKNPHFCKSALNRYTAADFIAKVESHNIAYHEKTLGQLFCDQSSKLIITMLTDDCRDAGVELRLSTAVEKIAKRGDKFHLHTDRANTETDSLVIATGGKSIPKMGATDFAYRIATQFGVNVLETRPALVPLAFAPDLLNQTRELSGVSVDAAVRCGATAFREKLLFTHRGISGPSILQISSYWREGDTIGIDLAPESDVASELRDARQKTGKLAPQTVLSRMLPNRLAEAIVIRSEISAKIGECSTSSLNALAESVNNWRIKPVGSEGYRTAEVTLGGIDTNELSSKTMEVRHTPGLYFIGEAVDVTGWLGGFNFQWAWSSGWAAGQVA